MPRLLRTMLATALLIGGCATVRGGDDPDHWVAIELANTLVTEGQVTVWVYTLGQYDRLGAVPPGETVAFEYELRRAGPHRLVAFRPGTGWVSRDSRRPPGREVASSDRVSLSTTVDRIYWDMSSGFVAIR